MTYEVQIVRDHPFEGEIEQLESVALAVLEHEEAPAGDLSIVLTSDEKMRDLNRRFAQIDRATDVLAFSDGSQSPDTGRIYFGDVAIAVPLARQQAERTRQTLAAELTLLTIHGVLHLLGHDHHTREAKKRMWQIQAEILDRFGYSMEPSESEA